MKFKDNRLVVINTVAGVIIFGALASFLRVTFSRPQVEVCSTRYNKSQMMSLDAGGEALSPAAIQASSYGLDKGVTDNLAIEPGNKAPSKFIMKVDVSGLHSKEKSKGQIQGVSFPWTPQSIAGSTAACLSYDAFLPYDFVFGESGKLPGIFAVKKDGVYDDETRVDTHLSWTNVGNGNLLLNANSEVSLATQEFGFYDKALPRGKWFRIEQELVLNDPGKTNGTVRLWLDGALQAEVKNADLRDNTEVVVTGVAGIIERQGIAKPDESDLSRNVVRISPFRLRWN